MLDVLMFYILTGACMQGIVRANVKKAGNTECIKYNDWPMHGRSTQADSEYTVLQELYIQEINTTEAGQMFCQ
jgi:hypothetical protein